MGFVDSVEHEGRRRVSSRPLSCGEWVLVSAALYVVSRGNLVGSSREREKVRTQCSVSLKTASDYSSAALASDSLFLTYTTHAASKVAAIL